MFNLFKRNKPKQEETPPQKVKLTEEQRISIEKARVAASYTEIEMLMSAAEKDVSAFSPEEKAILYQKREILKLLPPISVGILTRVSEEMNRLHKVSATKQRVHQILYPADPAKLFLSNSPNVKKVWRLMASVVDDTIRPASDLELKIISALKEGPSTREAILNELRLKESDAIAIRDAQKDRDAYRAAVLALEQLKNGSSSLLVGATVVRLRWITVKLRQWGVKYTISKDPTFNPPLYLIDRDPTSTSDQSRIFSFNDWLAKNRGAGIRFTNGDPKLHLHLDKKGEETVLGITVPVYHMVSAD